MKRRFSINDKGELVDRDGLSIGRVVAITLDLPVGGLQGGKDVQGEERPEEQQTQKDGGSGGKDELSAAVDAVWEHYVELFDAGRKRLLPARRRLIREALKTVGGEENITAAVDRVKAAVSGLRVSPHHNGQNDTGSTYLDIRYALRGNTRTGETMEERIDKMVELADRHGVRRQHDVPSASDEKIKRLLEQVRAALQQPDSATAVSRGRAAKGELEGMGFTVKRKGSRVWVERNG